MKTLSTAVLAMCLTVVSVGCAHTHPSHEDPANSESCGQAMTLMDHECTAEHAGQRTKGAIKTWSSQDRVTATDLNANFSHIHGLMVGGHGARLVDADVSSAAFISSSKLAAHRLIPVAWVSVSDCTGSPCTIISSSGVTSVTRAGVGSYSVNLTSARANTNYMGVVSPYRTAAGAQAWCYVGAIVSTSVVPVACITDSTPTADDSGFSIVIFDND